MSSGTSGDFYLVAEGPQDATVLVVGDVVGHGLAAARRAAFIRTTFAATAPYSDDPCRLLGWANVALTERASPTGDYVTAACVTYLPREHRFRWAYAGHPPALWLNDPRELAARKQGSPLGLGPNPGYRQPLMRARAQLSDPRRRARQRFRSRVASESEHGAVARARSGRRAGVWETPPSLLLIALKRCCPGRGLTHVAP